MERVSLVFNILFEVVVGNLRVIFGNEDRIVI